MAKDKTGQGKPVNPPTKPVKSVDAKTKAAKPPVGKGRGKKC